MQIISEVRADFEKWLKSNQWTFMMTLTTPYRLTAPSAHRTMERYFRMISDKDDLASLQFFWTAEKFARGDAYHIHGLIESSLNEMQLRDIFLRAAGCNRLPHTKTEIVQYLPKMHGVLYCIKQLTRSTPYDYYTKSTML
jgi:hypothetical protein